MNLFRRIALSVCFLSSAANADWETGTTPDGVTLSFLSGEIEESDANVPSADLYVLVSTGGCSDTAVEIAKRLEGKTVRYHVALSAAAYVADMTQAMPFQDNSIRAYHWSSLIENHGLTDEQAAIALNVGDQRILSGIVFCWTPRKASEIIGMMHDLKPNQWVTINTKGKVDVMSERILAAYVSEALE